MTTTVFRNENNLKQKEVLQEFKQALNKTAFQKSDIEELADIYAKNMVDKFIVSDEDMKGTFGRQGDILLWKEGSEMYDQEFSRVKNICDTNRLVLQKGDSTTGDHRLVPLKGSKFTLKEGKFIPSFLKNNRRITPYDCLLLDIDKPFLIVHREHGNMAYSAGKYMICSQLDPATLSRMID